MTISKPENRINEQILAPQVRLIDAAGKQAGIVPLREAQRLAVEVGLDLVEISPNASPPVCRLMDYRKYLFQQNKQRHPVKRKQNSTTKEMTFRPNTGKNDYLVKLNKIIEFLEHGHKVKISLRYRGRELSHQELGVQLIEAIKIDLELHGVVEQHPKMEGRQILMLVAPKKK